MQTPTIDKKKIRDQLKAKRNLLFEEFSKNPMKARLAIENRLIDDQIAELTEHLVQQR
jgi:Spy/CpxP family protein refolding chaperone